MTASSGKPLFFALPRDVLRRPPICSAQRPLKGRWTPFDMAIAGGILAEARLQVDQENRRRALEAGADAMKRERELHDKFLAGWREVNRNRRRKKRLEGANNLLSENEDDELLELLSDEQKTRAPTRQHVFPKAIKSLYELEGSKHNDPRTPLPLAKVVKWTGEHGYKKALRDLRRAAPPDEIILILSITGLLASASVSRNSSNREALPDALRALAKAVLVGDQKKSALLAGWEELSSGELQLRVCGEWLAPPFALVPSVLPLKSAPALALFMFCRGVVSAGRNRRAINVRFLTKLIGLDPEKPHWKRGLSRAINGVNDFLASLAVSREMDRRLGRSAASLPMRYAVEEIDGMQIRFQAVPRTYDDNPAESKPSITRRKKRIARPRPITARRSVEAIEDQNHETTRDKLKRALAEQDMREQEMRESKRRDLPAPLSDLKRAFARLRE
ncbi:hypothetical protein [Nitrobacter sp. JJSN]|uniref:hypothetical protein n=1 Tax=Nitrobacter sp. JJSN TaxID=3453033 RepID=UPI003F758F8F